MKIAVFTATASSATKAAIFSVLNLAHVSTHVIKKSPFKNSLLFHSKYVGNDTKFEAMFSELATKGKETERTIIFCQTCNQCALIWKTFRLKLDKKLFAGGCEDPRCHLVEMFHAGTPSFVKEHVLKEIGSSDSSLRVLLATVAFGMGVDCRQVYRIIQFGPSKNFESYLQEFGSRS